MFFIIPPQQVSPATRGVGCYLKEKFPFVELSLGLFNQND